MVAAVDSAVLAEGCCAFIVALDDDAIGAIGALGCEKLLARWLLDDKSIDCIVGDGTKERFRRSAHGGRRSDDLFAGGKFRPLLQVDDLKVVSAAKIFVAWQLDVGDRLNRLS